MSILIVNMNRQTSIQTKSTVPLFTAATIGGRTSTIRSATSSFSSSLARAPSKSARTGYVDTLDPHSVATKEGSNTWTLVSPSGVSRQVSVGECSTPLMIEVDDIRRFHGYKDPVQVRKNMKDLLDIMEKNDIPRKGDRDYDDYMLTLKLSMVDQATEPGASSSSLPKPSLPTRGKQQIAFEKAEKKRTRKQSAKDRIDMLTQTAAQAKNLLSGRRSEANTVDDTFVMGDDLINNSAQLHQEGDYVTQRSEERRSVPVGRVGL